MTNYIAIKTLLKTIIQYYNVRISSGKKPMPIFIYKFVLFTNIKNNKYFLHNYLITQMLKRLKKSLCVAGYIAFIIKMKHQIIIDESNMYT